MDAMGFQKYKPIFLQNEIDGEMLMQLLDEDLEEMVTSLDPRAWHPKTQKERGIR